MKKISITTLAVCIFTAIVFMAMPATAQEMQKAYTDAELAKVREWEKTWAGKTIDKTNVDQVAQFLPDTLVDVIKNPDNKWGSGPEGYYFKIRPYEFIAETEGFIGGEARVDEAPGRGLDRARHLVRAEGRAVDVRAHGGEAGADLHRELQVGAVLHGFGPFAGVLCAVHGRVDGALGERALRFALSVARFSEDLGQLADELRR